MEWLKWLVITQKFNPNATEAVKSQMCTIECLNADPPSNPVNTRSEGYYTRAALLQESTIHQIYEESHGCNLTLPTTPGGRRDITYTPASDLFSSPPVSVGTLMPKPISKVAVAVHEEAVNSNVV